jgi:hypothetical protein
VRYKPRGIDKAPTRGDGAGPVTVLFVAKREVVRSRPVFWALLCLQAVVNLPGNGKGLNTCPLLLGSGIREASEGIVQPAVAGSYLWM